MVSWFMRVKAITLWPFIICRDKGNPILIRHESIHIKQQAELFVIFFYILYLYDFVVGLITYRNSFAAYINIRFEQEAYNNQHDPNYLLTREPYSYRKYNIGA